MAAGTVIGQLYVYKFYPLYSGVFSIFCTKQYTLTLSIYSVRMILRHCFAQLRSTQIATIHCSAQTSPDHVLQKLQQTCMVLSTNTGRVYRPKDCETLVLYLKDLNLPKPDKWGTCQLTAFLQQVGSGYQGDGWGCGFW